MIPATQHYETEFRPELIASSATDDERQRGETDFRPLYYTYQYPSALNKLEMSFDLTYYQPQLSASAGQPHIYQTIFLDEDGSGELWTKGEIKQDSVIGEKWWKQQSHRWQHYARVVPWMWMINGTRGTWYALFLNSTLVYPQVIIVATQEHGQVCLPSFKVIY